VITYRRIVHEDARSIRSPEQLAEVNAFRVCGKRRFHPSLIGTAAGEPTTRTCQTLCWLTAVALRLRQIPRKLPIASPWPNTASSSALSHSTLMDPVAETLVGNFGWFDRFMTPSASVRVCRGLSVPSKVKTLTLGTGCAESCTASLLKTINQCSLPP
jgi:hypothetical protein